MQAATDSHETQGPLPQVGGDGNDDTFGMDTVAGHGSEGTVAEVRPEDRISCLRKVIFAGPTVATLPFVAMFGMVGNKNYLAFGASLSMIALWTALARSCDVISDPLVAYWTDSSVCNSLPTWLRGRRKPFLFFGCFFYSGFLWMLLNPPYASQVLLSTWFGVTYTLYYLSNTMVSIPYDALGPELSQDSRERTGLFFVSNLFDGCGTLIALGLPTIMTKFSTDYLERNEDICMDKNEIEIARLCLAGRGCDGFLEKGFSAAYQAIPAYTSLFSNISTLSQAAMSSSSLISSCSVWRRERLIQPLSLASLAQNDAFCNCMIDCGDACDVANARTGFMLVGYMFAIWFVIAMVLLVCTIPERERPSEQRQKAPPIVPSIRSALNNKLFCILLPAWLCDAFVLGITQSLFVYFIESVVAPAYQNKEDHGRDCVGEAGRTDSPNYLWLCNTDQVTAVFGLLVLVTAIVVLPAWNLLCTKLGKVQTWIIWTLTMAITNLLMLFVTKGSLYYLFFCAMVNGAPLGAKFLADAILADIIDYDEFLTGNRSEATYFMFKSFLPKIVQIPATAIPIALLIPFGYREPQGGKVQDQPQSVATYMRFMVGLGFLVSLLAFFLKKRYKLSEDHVMKLQQCLRDHKDGKAALDPLSDREFPPKMFLEDEKQEIKWKFDHFFNNELRGDFEDLRNAVNQQKEQPLSEERLRKLVEEGIARLVRRSNLMLSASLAFCTTTSVGAAFSMQLISSKTWSFVPTLCVVCVGLGVSSTAFSFMRRRASVSLSVYRSADCVEEEVRTKVEMLLALLEKNALLVGKYGNEVYKLMPEGTHPMPGGTHSRASNASDNSDADDHSTPEPVEQPNPDPPEQSLLPGMPAEVNR